MTRICCAGRRLLLVLLLALPLSATPPLAPRLWAQAASPKPAAHTLPAIPSAFEQRASRAFEAAKADKAAPLALDAFLRKMPKGADLHLHLVGAVYAETFIADAAADNLCLNLKTLSFTKNSGLSRDITAQAKCAAGQVPAANALTDRKLYDTLVDAFSMRSFVPSSGLSAEDQFFSTFDRFDPGSLMDARHAGEWLDELATRAAAQNEQYLEVMHIPSTAVGAAIALGDKFGWPATPPGASVDPLGDATGASRPELAELRQQLLAAGLRDEVTREATEFDDALAARDRIEHCGQPNALPACSVKLRWIFFALRALPPQVVFAQALLAFELASADPNVVGVNLVQGENFYLSMSEYNRQMHMLDYLHAEYPRVHISLHAGELDPGLVPPEGLAFHIREAIDLGHAERIGHGVDVMYESDPRALLREMAQRHIMVETNLTSNDLILGIVPPHHPLPDYRAAHVPIALSTDDEGVSRIDLTHEYVRAALEYGLSYPDLKAIARTSIEHSFLPGESLWQRPDDFTRIKDGCAAQPPASPLPTGDCLALLKSSQKAAQQWELEHRFAVFESSLP